MSEAYTIDELMCVCIARQVVNGEVLAQGIATPLVLAGLLLAKHTHAPDAIFTSAVGQGIVQAVGQVGVARTEDYWLPNSLIHFGFVSGALDTLTTYNPKEFFRPAQIDAAGNFNNIAIGKDYARPRMRLPGTGGIPDVTTYSEHVYLYVPRHSRVTFVEQVDFVSGLGHSPARTRGAGPHYLLSDLGQFDWHHGKMRLTHLHPDVTVEMIQKKTGFALEIADDLRVTEPPSADELDLLRNVIDPLGVRRLETLGGAARKALLREILIQEGAW